MIILRRDPLILRLESAAETLRLGRALAMVLEAPAVLALSGELGAGKTALAKGFIAQAAGCDPDAVTSPTFTLMNRYAGSRIVGHYDAYRLPGGGQGLLELGFADMLDRDGLAVIEWAERVADALPGDARRLRLEHEGEDTRVLFALHLPEEAALLAALALIPQPLPRHDHDRF